MTMKGWAVRWLGTCLALGVLAPSPGAGQLASVLHGRLEDAVTTRPIVGALVRSADGRTSVETDSLGAFVIALAPGEPLVLEVEMFGYRTETFELDDGATERISVLRLEPEAVELEGLHVLAETALEELLGDMKGRRAAYAGAVSVMDRTRLERFGDMTLWDLIRTRVPSLWPCDEGWSGLCARGRGGTIENPNPIAPVHVCIDDQRSWAAIADLEDLTAEDVSVVEIYGRGHGGIRVYTPRFIVLSARDGRNITAPLASGC